MGEAALGKAKSSCYSCSMASEREKIKERFRESKSRIYVEEGGNFPWEAEFILSRIVAF